LRLLLSTFLFFLFICHAQASALYGNEPVKEKDIVDIFKRKPSIDSIKKTAVGTSHFSFAPALGYTLQTGFAGLLSSNYVYSNKEAKPSEPNLLIKAVRAASRWA